MTCELDAKVYWSVVQSLEQRVGSLEASSNQMSRAWKRDAVSLSRENTFYHIASLAVSMVLVMSSHVIL